MKPRLTALLLTFSLIFSQFYLTFEAGHDCNGDNCRICQIISVIEQDKIGDCDSEKVWQVVSSFADLYPSVITQYNLKKYSLISLKIKLSA